MDICFVTEYFWPEIGGLERSTERLAAQLASSGHSVRVLTLPLDTSPSPETRSGFTIHRIEQGSAESFTHRAQQLGLFDTADFICLFGVGHDQEATHWKPILAQSQAFRGIKIGTEGDIATKGIDPALFTQFDAIFCQNDALVTEAISVGVAPDHCVRIKNGLDISAWQRSLPSRTEARARYHVPEEQFVVAGIGRFVNRKRFPAIVQAFIQACPQSISATLLLHGSDFGQHDGEEPALRALIANNSAWDIRIVSPEIPTQHTFAAADVFVTFGEREGAPNVILEALASGCPTIANAISGHQAYIRTGVEGILVDTPTVDTLAAAIRTYTNSDLRAEHSQHALKRAAEFDIRRTAEAYLTPVRQLKAAC